MLLMPYGAKWRTLRGIIHGIFSTARGAERYRPIQEFEGRQLVYDIWVSSSEANKDDGDGDGEDNKTRDSGQTDFYNHVRRYAASVVLTMVYGLRVGEWVSIYTPGIYDIYQDLFFFVFFFVLTCFIYQILICICCFVFCHIISYHITIIIIISWELTIPYLPTYQCICLSVSV